VVAGWGGPRTIVKSWAIGWFFFPHSHKVPVKGDSTSRGNAKHHTTRDTGGISFAISKNPLFLVRFVCSFRLLVKTNHGCFVGVNNVLTTPPKLHGQLTAHVRLSDFGIPHHPIGSAQLTYSVT